MLKKIDVAQLRIGMAIHDLDCGWMEHPFMHSRFVLTSNNEICKITSAGIRSVVIDCAKGIDVKDAPTLEEAQSKIDAEVLAIAAQPVITRVSLADEIGRATSIRKQACGLVKTVMQDARLGRVVELDKVAPMVESITDSILRNPGALAGLLRIKSKDDYTFLHSVSVCTLMVAFCNVRKIDSGTTYQAGLGGLLHDTGKALVPDHILNKAGSLTDEEFAIIKKHPRDGHDILVRSPGISSIALDITLHHHERRDGSGYPDKYHESQISELTRMAAIVDVYDAITSDRSYHKGMPAAEALRKIVEWSKFHFDPALAQEFVRCVGIYPVGTLVLLESGRLAVVTEAHETSLLTPTVNVFFNTKSMSYVHPVQIDLARPVGFGGGDRIVRHESPSKWKVDPIRFLSVAV